MNNYKEFIKQTPEDLDILIKDLADNKNWKRRINALCILGKYDCEASRKKILDLSKKDKVYIIRSLACIIGQGLKLKNVKLTKKNRYYDAKKINKAFKNIKQKCGMNELELDTFKKEFKNSYAEMYDIMKFEKNDKYIYNENQFLEGIPDNLFDDSNEEKFNEWIENIYKSLPKK